MDVVNSNYYGGAIWTHHVLTRIEERGISKDKVLATFKHSDSHFAGRQQGTIEYRKRFQSSTVSVVAKQNERSEWILLSAWMDPPLPGTVDAKKKEEWRKYQKASFWGKVWLEILRQMGIKKF